MDAMIVKSEDKKKELLNITEIAKRFSISWETARKWLLDLDIQPVIKSKRPEYPISEVENLEQRYVRFTSLEGKFSRGELPIFSQVDLKKMLRTSVPMSTNIAAVFFFSNGLFVGWQRIQPILAGELAHELGANGMAVLNLTEEHQFNHVDRIVSTW